MARPRVSKEMKIKELEKQLEDTRKWLDEAERRNQDLINKKENDFINSPTYRQMMEEIKFLKSINKLNENRISNLESKKISADETIRQIYQDNIKMLANYSDHSYFIGIAERIHETQEYLDLRSQVTKLQGKVEGLNTFLKDRDTEINRLQMVIAEMDQQQSDTVSQVDVIEHRIIAKENEKVVHPGRPKKITPEMIEAMLVLHDKGYSVRKIAEGMNVSVGTVHRYLQQM